MARRFAAWAGNADSEGRDNSVWNLEDGSVLEIIIIVILIALMRL
jgi:hypothetical protein